MNEKKLETKEELKSIIDAAFYDFDDYDAYCHDNDIDVVEDVEDFVADAIIKAGYVKQSEWISVEERLPEENGQYLASVDISHLAFENLTTITIMAYGKSHGFYLYNETEKVTHWMPLPEFPKKKGGKEE